MSYSFDSLPHRFPFRLIERTRRECVFLLPSVGSSQVRGGDRLPFALGMEALAQSAVLLLPGLSSEGEEESQGRLAGISGAREVHPLRAGQRFVATFEIEGRFGRMVKARGRLEGPEGLALEAGFLLSLVSV